MGLCRKLIDRIELVVLSPFFAYFVVKEFNAKYGGSKRRRPMAPSPMDDELPFTDAD